MPSASWIAAGDYRSSLAVNEWGGKNLAPRKQDLPGLAHYVIEVASKEELFNDCPASTRKLMHQSNG